MYVASVILVFLVVSYYTLQYLYTEGGNAERCSRIHC